MFMFSDVDLELLQLRTDYQFTSLLCCVDSRAGSSSKLFSRGDLPRVRLELYSVFAIHDDHWSFRSSVISPEMSILRLLL